MHTDIHTWLICIRTQDGGQGTGDEIASFLEVVELDRGTRSVRGGFRAVPFDVFARERG